MGAIRLSYYNEGREVNDFFSFTRLEVCGEKGAICKKSYEKENHLGNVRVVISDKKLLTQANTSATSIAANDYFSPDVVNFSDYYPFGQALPSRTFAAESYRYGFNGMEKNLDINSQGNDYTTTFRQYDARVARWKSLDPLMDEYAHISAYAAFNNNPIYFPDPEGLEGEGEPLTEGEVTETLNELAEIAKILESQLANLKSIHQSVEKMEAIIDEHDSYTVMLSSSVIFNPRNAIMGIVMATHYWSEGIDEKHEAAISTLDELSKTFGENYAKYTELRKAFIVRIQSAETIKLKDGSIGRKLEGGKTHGNSKSAKGTFALYEIKLDGEHYKFGLAQIEKDGVSSIRKKDITYKSPSGEVKTIPKGTPIRLANQERVALKNYDGVQVTYTVHKNVTKLHMLDLEDSAIWDFFEKNGYIGDGNDSHSKKFGAPQKGNHPSRLTTKSFKH
jgi:RHS repeat-associated protein